MNAVVVLAMVVVASEATTRAVATERGTKHCLAVAETTVPILATLLTPAETPVVVPATRSKSEGPTRKMRVAMPRNRQRGKRFR
jgi:hypothetical protein